MRVEIVMRVIPETELRGKNVLTIEPPATRFFRGHGSVTYRCGKCKTILAEDISKMEKGDKALKCNNCNSYNIV